MPSLKPLKSVAHSLAHHFSSTLCYFENNYAINHLAEASKRCHSTIVEIDLLQQTASPSEIRQEMAEELLPYLKNYFFELLTKEHLTADVVESVKLKFDFGSTRTRAYDLPTYDCVSAITTCDGRTYTAHLTEASN